MKDNRACLFHVPDAIERIFQYTQRGLEDFFKDPKTQDAVVRNLEIIGEAVKNISTALKAAYPDIPWRRIAGMRDKMIHEYVGVNLQLVWDVAQQELPAFQRKVDEILTILASGPLEDKGGHP